MQFLVFLFWPNPGNADYTSPKALALLVLALVLILLSIVLRMWRDKKATPALRRLMAGWPMASFVFGLIALLLVVSRVEGVQYLAMRFWWLAWALAALAYIYFQFRKFRMRYYEVLPAKVVHDSRDKYLPHKKR